MSSPRLAQNQALLYLNWLQNELPDANQELSIQLYDHFDQFPRLPVELRLKICEHDLPGPTVVLSATFWQNMFSPREITSCMIKRKFCIANRLPVTSKINQESRIETLRRYQIFRFTPSSCGGFYPTRLVFGPNDVFRTPILSITASIDDPIWHFGFVEPLEAFLQSVRNLQLSSCVCIWLDEDGELKDPELDIRDHAIFKLLKNVEIIEAGIGFHVGTLKEKFPELDIDEARERLIDFAWDYVADMFSEMIGDNPQKTMPDILTFTWNPE